MNKFALAIAASLALGSAVASAEQYELDSSLVGATVAQSQVTTGPVNAAREQYLLDAGLIGQLRAPATESRLAGEAQERHLLDGSLIAVSHREDGTAAN